MKIKTPLIIIIAILFSLPLFAQENSIHKKQYEQYKNNFEVSKSFQKYYAKTVSDKSLNKIVFGYLPWWRYWNNAQKYLRYDLLSHLAIFSFEADSLGNVTDPFGWPWNDVISSAKANKVKLILSVTNFDGKSIHKIFTNETVRNKFFANMLPKIKAYGFEGINIDFENLNVVDRNNALSNFMIEMKKYYTQQNMNLEMSFAAPIVNFSGWNFEQLVQSCDFVFIMAYEFYGSWSSTTGPSAPLTGGYFNISKSFDSLSDYFLAVQKYPNKIVLGVPYYGNYWRTKTGEPYITVDAKTEWIKHVFYNDAIKEYETKTKMWDNISNTSWVRWQDTTWKQIWFDNKESLQLKYDLAKKKNLGGIGIWALGYDDGRDELWKLIEENFAKPTNISAEKGIPTETKLFQNYPNPFNPETVIRYKVNAASHVTLKVYDILGNEVATLVNETKQPGYYYTTFFTLRSSLTSSVYFYKLTTNGYSETKKMLVLK